MNAPLRIALCEDDPKDKALLLAIIEQSGVACRCEDFSSGEELLRAFAPGKYDLIFLDIYMDGMKGVAAAAAIRETDRTVTLAFTTASTEHALESYRMKAAGYLEKPVKKADVDELLALVQAKHKTAAYITLLIGGKNREIPVESVLFFEQHNHAVTVHTAAEDLRTSQSVRLTHIEPLLPPHFFRCHYSFIVNLRAIRGLNEELHVFIMQDGSRAHIRHKDLRKAVKAYENCLFSQARGGGA